MSRTPRSAWFEKQFRSSAHRIADMDPATMSPAGRRLRIEARDMLANEEPVDYDLLDTVEVEDPDAPLAPVINLADYRRAKS